jgi:putative chitinase
MDYDKAEELRKKSFGSLLGEQEGGLGASLKSAISQKTQARMTGIKEKFDPMNIARAVGGKTGASIYGKVFGRDQKSMERFAGVRKKRISTTDDVGNVPSGSSPADVLGLIYRMMLRNAEDDKLQNELKRNKKEEEDKEEEDRNQQLIRALTGRKKPPTKKEKAKEKKQEVATKKQEVKVKKEEVKAKREEVKAKTEKVPEVKPKVEKVPEAAPPTPKVTAKPAVKPTAPTVSKAPTTAGRVTKGLGKLTGNAGVVAGALIAAGLSAKAQANILAQVESESNFRPRSENLNYSTPEAIQKTFGKNRIPTLEFAKTLVNNPEALANHVYAKTDGNSQPGDGWKYRGRGFLQHTGKNQYEAIKKYTGIDVVTNPDLLNDPVVAAKAIPWFFLEYKRRKPEQLEDISIVNKSVGFADVDGSKALKRAELAKQYEIENLQVVPTNNIGNQIDSSSKQNKDLKSVSNDSPPPVIINNTTSTQQTPGTPIKKQTGDDRSAYQKKTQG